MDANSTTELRIPSALVAEIQAAADEEHRPAADVVRDALERYLAEWRKGTDAGLTNPRTPAEAATHMREQRRGNVLPDGVTIRDLLAHGRA